MICHHYKCIFVHIPKNAGQSIESVFLDRLNLSWETRAPLLLRFNDRPELGPPSLAHLKADEYVRHNYLTQEMFDAYFKFTFVRNPWSRMVSIYKFLGFRMRCDFKTFLTGVYDNAIVDERHSTLEPQSDFVYADNGDRLVDFVGRFENLQKDFDHVCNEIGLPATPVPHRNPSTANASLFRARPKEPIRNLLRAIRRRRIPKYESYQEYYDQESIDLVAGLYQRDIELFGYDFDQELKA